MDKKRVALVLVVLIVLVTWATWALMEYRKIGRYQISTLKQGETSSSCWRLDKVTGEVVLMRAWGRKIVHVETVIPARK